MLFVPSQQGRTKSGGTEAGGQSLAQREIEEPDQRFAKIPTHLPHSYIFARFFLLDQIDVRVEA